MVRKQEEYEFQDRIRNQEMEIQTQRTNIYELERESEKLYEYLLANHADDAYEGWQDGGESGADIAIQILKRYKSERTFEEYWIQRARIAEGKAAELSNILNKTADMLSEKLRSKGRLESV